MHLPRDREARFCGMIVASMLQKTVRTVLDEGPSVALLKAARRARFVLDVAAATWKLRLEGKRPRNVDESLDFAFGFSVGAVTIAPTQVRSEIEALLMLLKAEPPQNVLEIGTARGGTLFLLSRVASADARLASIDLPGGDFGGGYDRVWVPLLKALPRERQTLKLLRADSHDSKTLDEARRWFEGKPLDFLLVDGDHHFEGVRRDFLMYGPLVRPGGVIAIHDIVPGREDRVGGAPRFWELVKKVSQTRELVDDWAQGGFGIGVVQLPTQRVNLAALLVDPPTADDQGDPEALA
jgi:predicted O-methyltransferase YrrM